METANRQKPVLKLKFPASTPPPAPVEPLSQMTQKPSQMTHLPPLNAAQIAARARRAERWAAINAEKAEAERRTAARAARQAVIAAKAALRIRALDMLEILAERWPACFTMTGIRPLLKVGIRGDIIDAAPDLDEGDVRLALRLYVQSGTYQTGLVAGAVRTNLYGQPRGTVTEAQAGWSFNSREEPA
jgi:hypothetical protein